MLTGWARTDAGRVRLGNEDAYWFGGGKSWYLALVADGMGGHQAGEVASYIAKDAIRQFTENNIDKLNGVKEIVQDLLYQAVQVANSRIYHQAQNNQSLSGMGTTVTALLFSEGTAHIAHVGDSRAYLFRQGKLCQLTEDHSLVQELVNSGSISSAEARYHPKRHLLTRVLGTAPDLCIDQICLQVEPKDLILLCTDGLTGELTDSEIRSVLTSVSPPEAVEELVNYAIERGGHDNVTVVLLQAGEHR